MLFFN